VGPSPALLSRGMGADQAAAEKADEGEPVPAAAAADASEGKPEDNKEQAKDVEDSKEKAGEAAEKAGEASTVEEKTKEKVEEAPSAEESKEEGQGDVKEVKEDAKEEGKKEEDKEEEKQEDKPAKDADEAKDEAQSKSPEKPKGFADADSDADGKPEKEIPADDDSAAEEEGADATEPPLKVAKIGQEEDHKARSRSSSAESKKGDHRKEEPTNNKTGGTPEGRERARQRMNANDSILNKSRHNVKDEELAKILEEHREDEYGYTTIDFSRNSITSKGIPDLVNICKRCPELKILKLFSNSIDDDGARRLADIFQHCKGIEEIHLSHNKFTAKGVELLVEAADEDLPKEAPRPLWLRMEHNEIEDPVGCVRSIESKFKSVCPREDRGRCLPRACVKNCRIHLPFLLDRDKGDKGSGKGKGRNDRGSWRGDNRRYDGRGDRRDDRRDDRWGRGRDRDSSRRRSPPRQAYGRQSYYERDTRGRYGGRHDCSRSRSRERGPPPRRNSAQDSQQSGRQRYADDREPYRSQRRYEDERPPQRDARDPYSRQPPRDARDPYAGAYQRCESEAEYSYYTDEEEIVPVQDPYRDNGRGRAPALGSSARAPARLSAADPYARAPQRSYNVSSARMGPSGRGRR